MCHRVAFLLLNLVVAIETPARVSPEPSTAMVYFKITDGHCSRKFWVNPTGATFESLKDKISSLFPCCVLDDTEPLHLHYCTRSGEKNTTTTDVEFQDLLTSIPDEAIWKFHISDFCNCYSTRVHKAPPLGVQSFPFGVRHSSSPLSHLFSADPFQKYNDPLLEVSASNEQVVSSNDCMSGTTHSRPESTERLPDLVKHVPHYMERKSLSNRKNATPLLKVSQRRDKNKNSAKDRKYRINMINKYGSVGSPRKFTKVPSGKVSHISKATQTVGGKSSIVQSFKSNNTDPLGSGTKISDYTSDFTSCPPTGTKSNTLASTSKYSTGSSVKKFYSRASRMSYDYKSTSSSQTASKKRISGKQSLCSSKQKIDGGISKSTETVPVISTNRVSCENQNDSGSLSTSTIDAKKWSSKVRSLPVLSRQNAGIKKGDRFKEVRSMPNIPVSHETLHLQDRNNDTRSTSKTRRSSSLSQSQSNKNSSNLLMYMKSSKESYKDNTHQNDIKTNENVDTKTTTDMSDIIIPGSDHHLATKASNTDDNKLKKENTDLSGLPHLCGDLKDSSSVKCNPYFSHVADALSDSDFTPCVAKAESWKPFEVDKVADQHPGANIERFGQWKPRSIDSESGKGILVGPVGYYVSWGNPSNHSVSNKEDNNTSKILN